MYAKKIFEGDEHDYCGKRRMTKETVQQMWSRSLGVLEDCDDERDHLLTKGSKRKGGSSSN